MPELAARGPNPGDTWVHALPADRPVTLGRVPQKSELAAPWDSQISGAHAVLTWQQDRLQVRKHPQAKNLIFFNGSPADEFTLTVGEQFVIGQTAFSLHETPANPGSERPTPLQELTCSHQELLKVAYADPGARVEILAALPELIRYSPSDQELEAEVARVLLRGIPRAQAAAVVRLDPGAGPADPPQVQVRAVAQRGGPSLHFQPSRRLLVEAVSRRRQSVLHTWGAAPKGDFTVLPDIDWALCAPLPDEPSPGWAVYVTGRQEHSARGSDPPTEAVHKSDLKFAEVVADVFGALRQVRDLQHRQGILARLLSRPVLAALAEKDMDEVLRPREAEVTVLFCDLRGSCRIAEEGEQDLAGVCARMGEALSIMTSNIIDKDGVIGDFQGDAAMGFWGWPLDSEDQVEQAARAALGIRRGFERAGLQRGHPLAGFACGIGIANGQAIAGRLGTPDMFKVGVFGPVVNLAARLESMTKALAVPILIDERCAERLRTPRNSHWCRCRRVAPVRPFGMTKLLVVSELLPSAVEAGAMSEGARRTYEAAFDAFQAGQWDSASELLERLPAGTGDFLRSFMERHRLAPPAGWDGFIALDAK